MRPPLTDMCSNAAFPVLVASALISPAASIRVWLSRDSSRSSVVSPLSPFTVARNGVERCVEWGLSSTRNCGTSIMPLQATCRRGPPNFPLPVKVPAIPPRTLKSPCSTANEPVNGVRPGSFQSQGPSWPSERTTLLGLLTSIRVWKGDADRPFT